MSTPITAPCSPETEQAVLGCAMAHPAAFRDAACRIGNRRVFFEQKHSDIWQALHEWYADHDTPPDGAALVKAMPNEMSYISGDMVNARCLPANIDYHVGELLRLWKLRTARDAAAELARCADGQNIDEVKGVLADLNEDVADSEPESLLPIARVADAPDPPAPIFKHGPAPGSFGLIVGGDGIGKGWITLDLLLSLALGNKINLRTLTPNGPPLRVVYVSYEEDIRILRWRLDRIVEAAGLSPDVWHDAESAGRLTFVTGAAPMFEQSARDVPQATPTLDALARHIKEHRVDLCVIDPLNGAARLQREGNEEFNAVALPLRRIAHETGCAMLLTHHPSKARAGDTDHQSLRGGASLGNDARWVLKITQDGQNANALTMAVSKNSYGRRVYGMVLERHPDTGVIREPSGTEIGKSREALIQMIVEYVEDNPASLNPQAVKLGRGDAAKSFIECMGVTPGEAYKAIEQALQEGLLSTESHQKANRQGYVDMLIPGGTANDDEVPF